jgi:hypothetical protein
VIEQRYFPNYNLGFQPEATFGDSEERCFRLSNTVYRGFVMAHFLDFIGLTISRPICSRYSAYDRHF